MTAVLLLSVFYAVLAFADLNFLSSRGRIGPGFFPQIIAVALVAFVLHATVVEFRRRHTDDAISMDWPVTIFVVAMVALLIIASHFLGALPGMVLFMLLALFVLNRGRHVTNLLVGLLLPIGLFTLFRHTLNAALPPGMLGLPF